MIIREKTVFVYDIEVFPNLFTLAIKNTESGTSRVYEISSRKNDLPQIVQLFLSKKAIYAGFNTIHYDNCLVSFLMMHYKELISLPI